MKDGHACKWSQGVSWGFAEQMWRAHMMSLKLLGRLVAIGGAEVPAQEQQQD